MLVSSLTNDCTFIMQYLKKIFMKSANIDVSKFCPQLFLRVVFLKKSSIAFLKLSFKLCWMLITKVILPLSLHNDYTGSLFHSKTLCRVMEKRIQIILPLLHIVIYPINNIRMKIHNRKCAFHLRLIA